MTIRLNDLAVFQFMLQLVKCKAAVFAQVSERPEPRICQSEQGLVLDFADKKAAAEIERRMTPTARRAVSQILEHVEALQAQDAAGLLQRATKKSLAGGDDDDDDDDDE